MSNRSSFPTPYGVRLGAAVLVALGLAFPADGRGPQLKSEVKRTDPAYREKSMPSQDGVSGLTLEAMEALATKKRLSRDVGRLRALGDELAEHVTSGRPLDYETIVKQTGEVNKRARRLKTWLVLVKTRSGDARDEKIEVDAACIPDTLSTLCARIDSFAASAMFGTEDEYDARKSAQASADLQAIVDLSDGIRQSADRLERARR